MVSAMLKRTCKPGEIIFREGDESTEAFWITSGRVEISINPGTGPLAVARLCQGELFGEMGLIDNRPRSATATAIGQVELDVVTEEDFESDVLRQPERLRGYLGTLFERLRSMDTMLELERSRNPAPPATIALPAPDIGNCPEPAVSIISNAANPFTGKVIHADVDRYPFRIGRAGDKWSPFLQNELAIHD